MGTAWITNITSMRNMTHIVNFDDGNKMAPVFSTNKHDEAVHVLGRLRSVFIPTGGNLVDAFDYVASGCPLEWEL